MTHRRRKLAALGLPALLVVVALGAAVVAGRAGARGLTACEVHVRVLGLNDLHGQLSAGRKRAGRDAGSAGVLAAWLRASMAAHEGPSFVALAGDCVGASPAASGLLQDEPTISFLNMLADEGGAPGRGVASRKRSRVVATLGNHEFDEGTEELLRLWTGGQHVDGPFLESRWRGARFPVVCANVEVEATGEPLVRRSVVLDADGVPLGFVGAVVSSTPSLVAPSAVTGLRFVDEADAINAEVRRLRRRRVRAIVVLLHEGGRQESYDGWTRDDAPAVDGRIRDIAWRLDPDVDLVVSGHSHQFTNARLPRQDGAPVLVTQAWSAGTALAEVDLAVDRTTRDVTWSRARILTTWADGGPGLRPSADASALKREAERAVESRVVRVVGAVDRAATRDPTDAGESALGNLVADAQRDVSGAEIAFVNPGGIRTDLDEGQVTWGELFAIQPFGNVLVTMDLTGAEVRQALEEQVAREPPLILQVSGLSWEWASSRPAGARVVSVSMDDEPLQEGRTYRVVVNSFLAAGGDGFRAFSGGRRRVGGPLDVDALEAYLRGSRGMRGVGIDGRIRRSEP